MRVAVIGASSFSGSAFVEYIASEGHSALLISRPEFDLSDTEKILWAIETFGADYVVNFAALNMVAESWEHQADYYATNLVVLSDLVARLARVRSLRKFVQVSTPEVYGATNELLAPSRFYRPSTPYAVSRAAADMALWAYFQTHGFPVVFTRTVNVYGEGQQLYRIIPRTIMCARSGERLKLHGGGKSKRSFIHIDDVARATLRVMLDGEIGEVYHIASRSIVRIRDLVAMICARLGTTLDRVAEDAPERPGKDPVYYLDDSITRRELGWTDLIPLEAGLDRTVRWFSDRYEQLKGQPQGYVHKG